MSSPKLLDVSVCLFNFGIYNYGCSIYLCECLIFFFFSLIQLGSVKVITNTKINQDYVLKWQQGFVNSEAKLASSNQIMGLPVSDCMNCDQK